VESAIRIEGLAQFSRALRKLDNDLPKLLRLAMNDAAAVVVDYGQARMPRRTGRAVSTIKARSTRTSVRVVEGGPKAPYVPWLDFGGTVGRGRRRIRTGRGIRGAARFAGSVKRPYYNEGRYLYPALHDKRDEIQAALENALTGVATAAGLELS